MSDGRYYWLKLPRNFFDKHYVKMLLEKENGVELALFYIRLLTESIDHEGRLRYSDNIPYTNESLAAVAGFPLDFTIRAMEVFAEMELAITESDGTIYLPNASKMIGSESESAARVRKYRENQKNTEKPKKTKKVGKPKTEKPKPENQKSEKTEKIEKIVNYLNEITGQHYRTTTAATQKSISARLDEGYTVEDFKTVIKSKSDEWLKDDRWRKYLTPDTLFRPSNFEKYLQAAQAETPKKQGKYSDISKILAKETDEELQNFKDDGGFA